MIKEADKNNDGEISFDEFKEMMIGHYSKERKENLQNC